MGKIHLSNNRGGFCYTIHMIALPLIVILGPTASGKTGFATELAKLIDGEIICADSRTVYRGMNIGTAKPTAEEQAAVRHWGINLVEPNQRFTLYDFQQYAKEKIQEIRLRHHVPMLVGGSGLYIDSIVYDYQLKHEQQFDSIKRAELEIKSLNELINYATSHHIELPNDAHNKRRLIRAIEQGGVNKKCSQLIDNTVVIGIKSDREDLRARSRLRSKQMLQDGLIGETKRLLDKYGQVEPLRRNAYGVVQQWLNGQIDESELLDKMVISDGHLVKKQLTWWRNPKRASDILWQSLDELNSQLGTWRSESSEVIIDDIINEYKNFKSCPKTP